MHQHIHESKGEWVVRLEHETVDGKEELVYLSRLTIKSTKPDAEDVTSVEMRWAHTKDQAVLFTESEARGVIDAVGKRENKSYSLVRKP